jgi:hypothetical protein
MKKIITALLFFCFSNILSAQPIISDIQPQGGGGPISSACIGQTIRITGSGFQASGMTITINSGSVISTYTFFTPAAIEVLVPPGTPAGGPGIIVTAVLASNARGIAINPGTTIFTPPTDQTVCEGNPFNFSVSASGGALAYSWKKNGGITGQTTTTISGSTLLADSGAIYTVDVINSACNTTTTTSPVTLHVNRKPTNPPTLPNLNNCQNGTFTLNATPPNVGSGSWACQSNCAGITFANTNIPNTQVNNVPVGGTAPVLRWTVVNGVCSVPSSVTLLNYAMPTTTSVITGADTNICTTSAPITLTGNTPSGTFTNVDWVLQGPATGTFGSPTVSYTTFAPTSGAGNYIVDYYIRNGACNSISSKQITVHNPPTPSAGGNYTHCFGSPLSLAGTAPGATSIFWSMGGGGNGSFSGVSGLNPTYLPFGADSLGVTFAVALNVSNAGCIIPASDTVTVTIRVKPQADIPVGSDATVCAGSSVLIPVNFIGTPPFSGIGLYNGVTNTDLGSVSGTTTSFSVSPTANTNYTLAPVGTFVDGFGCPGSWHGSSFITAAPGVAASINIVPGMICSGDNATLTINPSGGGGPGWKVYFNTGGANTMINVSGTYSTTISPASTSTYTVDSIETVGCGKIKVIGITKTVVVNVPPTVSAAMAINVADDTLCQGENTTVEITGVQLNTVYKLVKNYNNLALDSIIIGNTIPTSANVLLSISKFTPGKMDTIQFVARRPGCAVVPSANKAYVWASGLTTPVISASPTVTLCENKILLFSPQPNVTYQWYESGKMIVGATASKDTAFFGGSYSVKATDTLFCKLASNSIAVNYAGHEPSVSVTTISSTETKLSTSSAADTYFWYAQTSTGIKKIQGANANTISVYFDGNYYLGTITNSCFFMSAPHTVSGKLGGSLLKQSFVENDSTIILPEMDFSSDARAYPNPISESNLTIDYIAGDATKISFILYNPQGFPVVQKEVDGDGLIHAEIPTRGLPTGVYNLYINDGVKQVRKNIMIY